MPKNTHIISDLHLSHSRPDLFALFEYYMQQIAVQSEQLFVLGDLFEVWIGDDCLQEKNGSAKLYLDVIALFKDYSVNHGKLFFMHGNRDFLLKKQFEEQTGGALLDEPHFITLSNKKVALMHGDSLCTDDTSYQQFRNMVRNPQWQNEFLSLPISKRIEIAMELRQQSKESQADKSAEIMDVNQQAVEDFFESNDIDWLIHGHTHRQASHDFSVGQKGRKRIVLSDWGQKGFYLSFDEKKFSECYFNN